MNKKLFLLPIILMQIFQIDASPGCCIFPPITKKQKEVASNKKIARAQAEEQQQVQAAAAAKQRQNVWEAQQKKEAAEEKQRQKVREAQQKKEAAEEKQRQEEWEAKQRLSVSTYCAGGGRKGRYGLRKPNQDGAWESFGAKESNKTDLLFVFDGHGENGHDVVAAAKKFLDDKKEDGDLQVKTEKDMKALFADMSTLLESDEYSKYSFESGAAVAALALNHNKNGGKGKAVCGWLGDCSFYKVNGKEVKLLTPPHDVFNEDEAKRLAPYLTGESQTIEIDKERGYFWGSILHTLESNTHYSLCNDIEERIGRDEKYYFDTVHSSNDAPYHVTRKIKPENYEFIAGKGLAMSRVLGDRELQASGIISTPEIKTFSFSPGQIFVGMSDGWFNECMRFCDQPDSGEQRRLMAESANKTIEDALREGAIKEEMTAEAIAKKAFDELHLFSDDPYIHHLDDATIQVTKVKPISVVRETVI